MQEADLGEHDEEAEFAEGDEDKEFVPPWLASCQV
jgi:hypothetical protein